MTEKEEIELKVIKARPNDAEKGIVRLDSKSMKKINVAPGDVVELEGERKSVAVAAKAYPSDVGREVVRMDGILRRNSGGSIGEHIKIRKAEVKEADKVVLAPAQKGIQIQMVGSGIEKSFMGRPVMKGDIVSPIRAQPKQKDPFSDLFSNAFEPMFGFANLKLMVVSTKPKGPVVITDMTQVQVNPKAVEMKEMEKIPQVTYEDIGGLGDEISKVREMIELPLKHPELFDKLGIEPPKGVLLHGPPGTGKTLLAKAVANETHSNFMSINGPEIMSKWYGESEKRLRQVFEEAEKNAPTIIFIDEIDAIAPKREEVKGEVERRVVATLLSQMDGLKSRGKVVVIAATNRVDALDSALRRGGRFDREIEIGVPDRKGRKEILQIHTRAMPLDKNISLDKWADVTYGYVGADLEALAKEAAMAALRRTLPKLNLEEEKEVPTEIMENLRVNKKDFKSGLRNVSPSAMREVMVEVPKLSWKDVGGLENVKQELKEAVEWPLKKPKAFKNMGIHPPKGVLLFGPPGTGKTMLAKAVANESDSNFISVRGPELLSKWVGESERGVRKIFKKARQVAPSVIFFDELDALAPKRGGHTGSHVTETVVNQLLTELDGLEELENVVVIASTNRPDIIDPGLLRPGRFDRHILTPVPDEEARKKIFEVHTRDMPLADDVKLDELAELTENYVGADIEALCREAAMLALRKDIKSKKITMKNFKDAMETISPTMSDETKQSYEEVLKNFKQRAATGSADKPRYVG
ncbi:MAG: CDC48 family AAA ATPase [Candidatus Undinarchaeales archaeon]